MRCGPWSHLISFRNTFNNPNYIRLKKTQPIAANSFFEKKRRKNLHSKKKCSNFAPHLRENAAVTVKPVLEVWVSG